MSKGPQAEFEAALERCQKRADPASKHQRAEKCRDVKNPVPVEVHKEAQTPVSCLKRLHLSHRDFAFHVRAVSPDYGAFAAKS